MANLDVDSLFISIPLEEIIDICIDSLYKDNENITITRLCLPTISDLCKTHFVSFTVIETSNSVSCTVIKIILHQLNLNTLRMRSTNIS